MLSLSRGKKVREPSYTTTPTLLSRLPGAFHGALVTDAFCLVSHYENDASTIKAAYSRRIKRNVAPGESMGGSTHGIGWGRRNYHQGQKACDQTDNGEYYELWLEYLADPKYKSGPIEVQDFQPMWNNWITNNWGA